MSGRWTIRASDGPTWMTSGAGGPAKIVDTVSMIRARTERLLSPTYDLGLAKGDQDH
jgi:hypothetical protein